jgi:propionyl-CoA synthetase
MPMIPEAIFSMLASARIGAIHSVVFGGFSSYELANRIMDCKPALIMTSSCGMEPNKVIDYKKILDEALNIVSP